MKKKSKLVMILIIIIPLILIGLILTNNGHILGSVKKQILLEKSYTNFAWGQTYEGMAICTDGTVYKWNMDDKYFDELSEAKYGYSLNLEDASSIILKYAELTTIRVSSKDLESLKKNISNLNGYTSLEYGGSDMGSHSVIVWDYSKKQITTIKTYGDMVGENETEEAQEIIRIADKYLRGY